MTTAKVSSNLVHATARPSVHELLLVCGVIASLVYVATNVVGTMLWSEYSSTSQNVSELYAIGAPSRPWILPIGLAFDVLLAAFAVGVWQSARGKRALRVTAAMLFAVGVIGPFWPPMHLRGANTSLTDTLHVVVAGVVVLLNVLAMAFGASTFGKRFRVYTFVSLAVMLFFGALTSVDAPRVPANLPTPWMGLYERINIAGWLLWIAVLAIGLLRAEAAPRATRTMMRVRAAKDENARYALELVEAICARVGPGIPGTRQERERAAIIESEMKTHLGADNVLVEEFTLAPAACVGVFPISAALVLAAALANVAAARVSFAVSLMLAFAAVALSLLAVALFALEFVLEKEVVDRFFPKRKSVNVIGTLRAPNTQDPQRLLIVSAHHDSAPENTWLALLGYGSVVLSAAAFLAFAVIPIMSVIQIGGLVVGSAQAFRTGTLGWGLLAFPIVPGVLFGAFFNRGWKRGGTVPGAADNLSGSALVVALGKMLAARPALIPADTEIRFVTFGAEEAGLRGSRRYVERHLDELERLHARVLNFETIANPSISVLTSDVHGTVKSSPKMVESVVAAAARARVPYDVKPAFLGVATDAGPFSRAGIDATALLGFEVPRQLVAFYHQKSDRPDVIDPDALSNALKIALEWIARG